MKETVGEEQEGGVITEPHTELMKRWRNIWRRVTVMVQE